MPTTTINPTVELLSFEDLLDFAANNLDYAGQTELLNQISSELRANPYRAGGLTTKEAWANEIQKKLTAAGYEVQYNGNGTWSSTFFSTQPSVTTQNPVNSNLSTVSRGNVRNWYGGISEFDVSTGYSNWVPTRFPVSGGLGSKALYLAGSFAEGYGAVSTGIWLGKTIDSALYAANPNFWDSIGLSTLNPDRWGAIINDGGPFSGLMNFILGVSPDDGQAYAYIDENALAYVAYCMYNAGVFNTGDSYIKTEDSTFGITNMPVHHATANVLAERSGSRAYGSIDWSMAGSISGSNIVAESIAFGGYGSTDEELSTVYGTSAYITYVQASNSSTFYFTKVVARTTPFPSVNNGKTAPRDFSLMADGSYGISSGRYDSYLTYTYDNRTVYYYTSLSAYSPNDVSAPYVVYSEWNRLDTNNDRRMGKVAWSLVYDTETTSATIDGIGNQDNAQMVDTTGWTDPDAVLQSLQQQYPDSFANPMIWNSDDPASDEIGNTTRYIQVPFPEIDSNGNPVSATQTQASTEVSTSTSPQTLLDLIMDYIQQTQPATETEPTTPPQNPIDTGTGGSPTPVATSGSASALWSVYHPTQTQVNSFGAWLWTDNIITQIQQVLQNPMEGIITLHKVFATPVDAGTGTIVVGRLDSQVPSATVTEQYVTVDCGSVDCHEQFGNVFDYDPFTKISLYLPFIGIVPLNIDDVMRSTINVTYGVDVFTGACLAMVNVSRDNHTVNMYQYAGVASVEYPLTGSVHGGLISGLLGLASGAVGAALASTGVGAVAGVATMAGGLSNAAKSNNARSGGFSGNSGAMGIKIPYLIIERPQTKVAETFPRIEGYPTNYSSRLGDLSGQVNVKSVHVEGINATDVELKEIESLLKSGVLV